MTSRKRSADEQDAEDTQAKKSRASYKGAPSKTDPNGDTYWEVSKMRRVTVSKFRGRTMVNVREYYEKDGQELPGKKVSKASQRNAVQCSANSYRLDHADFIMPVGNFLAGGTICCSHQAAS